MGKRRWKQEGVVKHDEAIGALLSSLPRCCNCNIAAATIIDAYRWPLCEACWRSVPGSDHEKPSVDMRKSVSDAHIVLRESMTDEVPATPLPTVIDLEEQQAIQRKIQEKVGRRLGPRPSRRIPVFFFCLGVIVTEAVHILLHL